MNTQELIILPILLMASSLLIGQKSNRFSCGLQSEFSIDFPDNRLEYDLNNLGYYGGNRGISGKGIQYEHGFFAGFKLSRRLNIIGSLDLRFHKHFGIVGKFKFANQFPQSIEQYDIWKSFYKSVCWSQSIGLNYELIKLIEFDIIVLFAFNPSFIISYSNDYEYITSRFSNSNLDDTFAFSNDVGEIREYHNGNYFVKYEFGIGLKFRILYYELIFSRNDEIFGSNDLNFGLRIRYQL